VLPRPLAVFKVPIVLRGRREGGKEKEVGKEEGRDP